MDRPAASLDDVLSAARSVWVVAGDSFDHRKRNLHLKILECQDDAEIHSLIAALEPNLDDLVKRYSLMTPGNPTIAFFGDGHEFITSVTLLGPNYLRWRAWHSDVRLKEPSLLVSWFLRFGLDAFQ